MKSIFKYLLFIGVIIAATKGVPTGSKKWKTLDGNPTILIGHRGEKVFMPEHTIGSYELAAAEGAEFVEPDLTLTSDGELVCYHDVSIKSGTDVQDHKEFRNRMRSYTGWIKNSFVNYTNDWFIQDFTAQELKTLRVKQKNTGIRPQYFNDLFYIPTFREYLEVIQKMSFKLRKPIGVIPELKYPSLNNAGRSPHYMEDELLKTLREFGYPITETDKPACKYQDKEIPCGKVIIQSFDSDSLQYLQNRTIIPLMMLVLDDPTLLTYNGLDYISGFASYLGVWKEFLYVGPEAVFAQQGKKVSSEKIAEFGGFVPASTFVDDVHKLGLKMSIFTIYDSREPSYRGCAKKCEEEDKTKELYSYFEMGVDSIFVENIMEARELRLQFENEFSMRKSDNSAGYSALCSGYGCKLHGFVIVVLLISLF